MAKQIVGRLYNLGNDYPGDVGCRPVSGNWKAESYLDGIYTEAEAGYVTGGWNKYFNTVLPQEDWTPAQSGDVFPDEYAVAQVQVESAYKEAVSAYPSSGIDAINDDMVEDLSAWKSGTSPYIKNFPKIGE